MPDALYAAPGGVGGPRAVAYTEDPVDIKPEFVLAADWGVKADAVFVQGEVVVCAPVVFG